MSEKNMAGEMHQHLSDDILPNEANLTNEKQTLVWHIGIEI